MVNSVKAKIHPEADRVEIVLELVELAHVLNRLKIL